MLAAGRRLQRRMAQVLPAEKAPAVRPPARSRTDAEPAERPSEGQCTRVPLVGSSSDCALGESRAHVASRTLSSEARSMSALPADEQNGRLWPSVTRQQASQPARQRRRLENTPEAGAIRAVGVPRTQRSSGFGASLQVAEKRTLEDIDGDRALGGAVSAATDREPSDRRRPTSWRSLETVGAHV